MLFKYKNCPNCQHYYEPTLEQCPNCHKDNELYRQRRISDKIVFLHPIAQIGLFLAGFAYFGMLISEFVTAFFLAGVADKNLKTALILFFTYLLMLGALLVIILTTRRKTFFKKFTRKSDYLFGLAYAGGLYSISLLIGIIVGFFYEGINNNQSAAISMIENYPIFAGLIICLMGPICEELTYRVGLYSFFRRINKVLAFVVTIIVFALIHFDFMAEDMIGELWSLPSYLACGAVLTIAYDHRGPACSITAHVVYNSIAMLMIILRGLLLNG